MDCFRTNFTSGRHCHAVPWKVIYRPSRHVRTSHAGAAADKERHVPSRHVTSGRHRRRRGQGGRHVTSRQDVTSGHHRRRRGQGCRHVTSRQEMRRRRGQGGRRVTSRRRAQGGRHVKSRHVTTSGAPRADHAHSNR